MRKRFVSLVSVIALAGLAGVVAPAAPAAAAVNEVTNWNRIATDTLVQFPGLAGGAPPALQINMGMVQGAVYDAVNAIEPMHEPYLLQTTFPSTASKEAAVATAAYTVLTNIIAGVPDTVPFPPGTVSFPNEADPADLHLELVRRFARRYPRRPVQDRRDRRRDSRRPRR